MAQVTKELQDLVKKNKLTKAVYFDSEGNHYFNKHEIELHEVDDRGVSLSVKKVWCLPGAKRTKVTLVLDKRTGKFVDKIKNTECVLVHEEMTRKEVLDAKPVYKDMTDDEKLEILSKASAIAKQEGFQDLLKKLK